MLLCSQCRFENPLSNRFCQVCGSPLPESESIPAETESVVTVETEESVASTDYAAVSPASLELHGPEEAGTATVSTEAQVLPKEVFATIPPGQADYHQSLKEHPETSEALSEDLSEGSPGTASTQTASCEEGLQKTEASPEAVEAHAIDKAQEESWDESTVWMGSSDGGDDDSPTVVLPMQLARLDSAGISHVGRQREHNEDNFDIQTEIFSTSGLAGQTFSAKGLYILCDGMGGHSGGEVASAMVVNELKRYFAEHWKDQFPSKENIASAIASANQVVYDANESDERLGNGRMGTTLVLVLIEGTKVAFAHVGDSRLYTYSRRQGLIQRTVDHEVGQLEVMRGVDPEVAYGRPESYQLTQALGPKDNDYVNPGLEFMELQEDTLFLLCSDGLSDYSLVEDHADEKVAPLLGSRAILEQGVNDLVHLANELSGHDNITAVAIRAKVRPDAKALA